MATETVTEYETVERERERVICDSCGEAESGASELSKALVGVDGDETYVIAEEDTCVRCASAEWDDVPEDIKAISGGHKIGRFGHREPTVEIVQQRDPSMVADAREWVVESDKVNAILIVLVGFFFCLLVFDLLGIIALF
jgi:hypothetical protein